jgi:SAM-dependent methyltransferase
MPFTHDHPSLERSPEQHDREAVPPGSTEADLILLREWLIDAPAGPILDIGCGSGRHVRALCAAGHPARGIDLDPRMIAAARQADPAAPEQRYQVADACAGGLGGPYAVICLLNRSLVCFHSHRQALGLFRAVAAALLPGGRFCIDNCCTTLWDEVRCGNFADGVSPAGDQQLFFLPGENRFVWRRDQEVDQGSWTPRPQDRIYRLWSLGEIALAAAAVGLTITCLDAEEPLIVVERP